jgi:hypothetical protein
MANEYKITPAQNWDGPHGTGYHQDSAGQGRHELSRRARAAQVRAEQQMGYVRVPVQGGDQVGPFGLGALQTERVRRSRVPAIAGAVLGVAIERAIRRRMSR